MINIQSHKQLFIDERLIGEKCDVTLVPDLSTLAGRPMRLRLVMHSAMLFALQFVEKG